jgi:hypothetical protein
MELSFFKGLFLFAGINHITNKYEKSIFYRPNAYCSHGLFSKEQQWQSI